jgi:hypothetical protein
MTYHDQQRRNFDEAPVERPMPDSGISWGLPLGLVAVVIIVGAIFYNVASERTTTASNNTPAATQSAPTRPSAAPGAVAKKDTSAPDAQSTPSPNVGTARPPAK